MNTKTIEQLGRLDKQPSTRIFKVDIVKYKMSERNVKFAIRHLLYQIWVMELYPVMQVEIHTRRNRRIIYVVSRFLHNTKCRFGYIRSFRFRIT